MAAHASHYWAGNSQDDCVPWKAGTGASDFSLTLSNPALVREAEGSCCHQAGTDVANPLGQTGTLGVRDVPDQRGVRDELLPCLQKESLQVWLERSAGQ